MSKIKKCNIYMICLLLLGILFELSNFIFYIPRTGIIYNFREFIYPGIAILFYFIFTKESPKKVFKIKAISIKNIIMIIILAVSFMPVSSLISTISNLIFPNPIMQSAIKNASTGNILWFALIVTALQPAIFEELSFRGIVASSFEEYPTKIAAIMSGMYFGFFHLNFNQFFYASAVGIVMFYLLYYTKSIFASMIFHFTNNGISALLGHILTSQKSTETTGNVSAISYILGFAFILAIFVPIFIAVFRAFVSYNKKHNMPSETISYTLNDTNLETDLDSIKKQKILTPTFFIVSGIFIAFASFIQIYYNIIIRR